MQIVTDVPIRFTLNGETVHLEVAAVETALQALRTRLKLKGTKEGCGIGECGACTIVVDGGKASMPVSCLLPSSMAGR